MSKKERKPKFKVENLDAGELKKKIEQLVAKSSLKETEKNLELNCDIEFTRIKIEKEDLFYYLRNNRTKKDCVDYIKKQNAEGNSLPEDFFAEKNIETQAAQQSYHEIIFSHADKNDHAEKIKTTYLSQSEQRDPIYISSEGVIVNGNTRVSVIRELMEWRHVECLVYPPETDYETMESQTSQKDNYIDFSQEDAWYGKEETFKDLKAKNMDDRKIAIRMNYFIKGDRTKPDVNSLHNDIHRCQLVQEFLDFDPNDKYTYVSDLVKLGEDGRGGGDGKQAFGTLQQKIKKIQQDYPAFVALRIKDLVWNRMASENKVGSDYQFITTITKPAAVDKIAAEFSKRNSEGKGAWPPIIETAKDQKEIEDIVQTALDDAIKAAEFSTEAKRREAFIKLLKEANSNLKGALDHLFMDFSFLDGAEEFLDGAEDKIAKIKKRLKE